MFCSTGCFYCFGSFSPSSFNSRGHYEGDFVTGMATGPGHHTCFSKNRSPEVKRRKSFYVPSSIDPSQFCLSSSAPVCNPVRTPHPRLHPIGLNWVLFPHSHWSPGYQQDLPTVQRVVDRKRKKCEPHEHWRFPIRSKQIVWQIGSVEDCGFWN